MFNRNIKSILPLLLRKQFLKNPNHLFLFHLSLFIPHLIIYSSSCSTQTKQPIHPKIVQPITKFTKNTKNLSFLLFLLAIDVGKKYILIIINSIKIVKNPSTCFTPYKSPKLVNSIYLIFKDG